MSSDAISEQLLYQYISSLEARKQSEAYSIQALEDIKCRLHEEDAKEKTVALGSGYFVTLPQVGALQFLDRSLRRLKLRLEDLEQKLKSTKQTAEQINILNQRQGPSPVNELEGMLIVDIQENLDEEGNVLDVKLSDSLGNVLKNHNIESGPTTEVTGELLDVVPQEAVSSPKELISADDQITELLKDMGIDRVSPTSPTSLPTGEAASQISPDEPDRVSTIEESAVADLSLSKAPESRAVNDQPIFELELLASEFNESDAMVDEHSGFDYEFDSDSDSENDSEDERKFALLMPQNVKLQDRFWQEVSDLRRRNTEKTSKESKFANKNKSKSVRFSDALEIQSFEDLNENTRTPPEKKTILRFKKSRISAGGNNDVAQDPQRSLSSNGGEITTDIMEHVDNTGNGNVDTSISGGYESIIQTNINELSSLKVEACSPKIAQVANYRSAMESNEGESDNQHIESELSDLIRDSEGSNLMDDKDFARLEEELRIKRKKERQSKFKRLTAQNPLRKQTMKHIVKSISAPLDDQLGITGLNNVGPEDYKVQIRQVDIDLANLQDDTDAIAQAYNTGFYDDDLELRGPIVDELKDFEILNKMVLSKTRSTALESSDIPVQPEDAEEDQVYETSLESDNEILRDQILENELSDDDEDKVNSMDEDDPVQMSVIQQEIAEQYHRLRQKVLAGNPAKELEYEPIEEGTPRMSRFKSTRRHMR